MAQLYPPTSQIRRPAAGATTASESSPFMYEVSRGTPSTVPMGYGAVPPTNVTLLPSSDRFRAEPPQSVPWIPPSTTKLVPPDAKKATKDPPMNVVTICLQNCSPFSENHTFSETCAPYICEFVGTFMLAFTVATCAHTAAKPWMPTAVGCVVIVILYAVGFVSGGHLNPAVSLACLLARKMSACRCLGFIIVQTGAGIAAGFVYELAFATRPTGMMPVAPFGFAQAALVETIFTTMLCFVFLNVTVSTRNNPENDRNQFFALAVGFVIIAAGYASSNISGAAVNPAISFGLDVSGGDLKFGVPYALCELLGGVIAALLFRICRGEDYIEGSLEELAMYVPSLFVRLFCEFVGSFYLVLTFGLSTIMLSNATAWAAAAALTSMVYALGNVSGGHFNPAVTVAVWLSGRNKCSRSDALCYALVQLFGGIMAGLLMSYMHNRGPTKNSNFGLVGLSSGYHWGTIATVEILFTFLMAYVVLAVATSEEYTVSTRRTRQNFYFALAIGLAMSVGIFGAGSVSGGYVNPAAALGFAVEAAPDFAAEATVNNWPAWSSWILRGFSLICKVVAYLGHWMLYLAFELVGAALAAGVFRFTHPADYKQKPVLGGLQARIRARLDGDAPATEGA